MGYGERMEEGDLERDRRLAEACAAGDSAAIAELERLYFSQMGAAVTRVLGSSAERDDALQTIRRKLLVGEAGKPARIGEYAGRGSLAGWLRVVAVRTAISMKRGAKREQRTDSDEPLLDIPAVESAELGTLRARYKDEFKAAFQASLAALSPRDRNVLRLSYLDGLNIDQIGAVYRVHRATVARWLAAAREQLFDATRERLSEKLGLTPSEFTSIVALVRSHVDLSLHRYLAEDEE